MELKDPAAATFEAPRWEDGAESALPWLGPAASTVVGEPLLVARGVRQLPLDLRLEALAGGDGPVSARTAWRRVLLSLE